MDVYGEICSEKAPDSRGGEVDFGPRHRRSISLDEIIAPTDSKHRDILTTTCKVPCGDLRYKFSNETKAVQHLQQYGPIFNGKFLGEVNNDNDGDCRFVATDEFYPSLFYNLKDKKMSGKFNFRGRACFQISLMEWTEHILIHNRAILCSANIYGAIDVSRFPYALNADVWRAFVELWGPQTNTFHHSGGEMGISLYDLKRIGGLPILGIPYEEFIPPNAGLLNPSLYSPTVAELLRTHSRICKFLNATKVSWGEWIEYFYRGDTLLHGLPSGASAKPRQTSLKGKSFLKERPSLKTLRLNVSKECMFAAFLSLWLSRFVFPYRSSCIRPETFYMATLMAQGKKVSLAPSVLGYIYHALSTSATDPRGFGVSEIHLPIHYVIGWLAEYFPCLYSSWDVTDDSPRMRRVAGLPADKRSLNAARSTFRGEDYVRRRPFSFPKREDTPYLDDESLSDDIFELLVSLRPSILPVRVGNDLYLEAYYPNRFARQFGFDQGVPSNNLYLSPKRGLSLGILDVKGAWDFLLRRNTSSRFEVPSMTRTGQCTWWYGRWWVKCSTPYLGRSVKNIHSLFSKQPYKAEDPTFIITDIKKVYETLDDMLDKCRSQVSGGTSEVRKRTSSDGKGDSEAHHKRTKTKHARSSNIEPVNVNVPSASKSPEISNVGLPETTEPFSAPINQDTPITKDNLIVGDEHIDDSPFREDEFADYNPLRDDSPFGEDFSREDQLKDNTPIRENIEGTGAGTSKCLDIVLYVENPRPLAMIVPPPCNPIITSLPQDLTFVVQPSQESVIASTSQELNIKQQEPLASSTSRESSMSILHLVKADIDKLNKNFMLGMLRQIFTWIFNSKSPRETLTYRSQVFEYLDTIGFICAQKKLDNPVLYWLRDTLADFFDSEQKLVKGRSLPEEKAALNSVEIKDLLRRDEERLIIMKSLSIQAFDAESLVNKEKATEEEVIRTELEAQTLLLAAQQLRQAHEDRLKLAKARAQQLKASLEKQQQLGEELQILKNAARVDRYLEIEAEIRSQEEESRKIRDSLAAFFKEDP